MEWTPISIDRKLVTRNIHKNGKTGNVEIVAMLKLQS